MTCFNVADEAMNCARISPTVTVFINLKVSYRA